MLLDVQADIVKLPGSQDATKKIVDLSKAYLEKLAAEKSSDLTMLLDVSQAYLKLGDIQGRSNVVSYNDRPAARKSRTATPCASNA